MKFTSERSEKTKRKERKVHAEADVKTILDMSKLCGEDTISAGSSHFDALDWTMVEGHLSPYTPTKKRLDNTYRFNYS